MPLIYNFNYFNFYQFNYFSSLFPGMSQLNYFAFSTKHVNNYAFNHRLLKLFIICRYHTILFYFILSKFHFK